MGLEQARAAMDAAPVSTPDQQPSESPSEGLESSGAGSAAASGYNGSGAPDSAKTQETSSIYDLTKAEKFMWDGKEMTPDELRKAVLRQQDYTKKTQALAEERRRYDQERQDYIRQREETEKYESNIDADIQHVLRDPSLEAKFKELYPEKYHSKLEQALDQALGDKSSPTRRESLLERRLAAMEQRAHMADQERQKASFNAEVQKNTEVLESALERLKTKYPDADEESVLAKAENMASYIKKDDNFNANFMQMMEKLFKENSAFHEKRYQERYKSKVEQQKQGNAKAKDMGRGGATPAAAPTKLKLKDVKHHIQAQLEANKG